jgi:hypothetical protein
MLYAEASYFDGYHFHHIAAYERHKHEQQRHVFARQDYDRRRNGRARRCN